MIGHKRQISVGWGQCTSIGHKLEESREGRYRCLLCGGRVRGQRTDWCKNDSCQLTIKASLVQAALTGEPAARLCLYQYMRNLQRPD